LGRAGTIIGWVALGVAGLLFILLAATIITRLREKGGS